MGNSNSTETIPGYENYSDDIKRFRTEADKFAKQRNECFQKSQEAWKAGNKAEAKELSNKGKGFETEMTNAAKKAAEATYKYNNKSRPENEIDLHGLFVEEAKSYAEKGIQMCITKNLPSLIIIVGRGNHSVDNIPKVKPAIQAMIQEHNLNAKFDTPNPGCITLLFQENAEIPTHTTAPPPPKPTHGSKSKFGCCIIC